MALRYGFFNSKNGDRKYDAIDISSIFDGIIEDGVFGTIGEQFTVTPGEGLQVIVGSGKAWFHHTWTSNDAPIPLNLETPDITLDRYDAVVLEINNEENVRANAIKILKGTSQSIPQKPSLIKSETVNQYPLAYVLVKHGSSSITSSEIEIMVGKGECPFVTGPLESVPVDQLFSQWESDFNVWFDNVQAQLEGDIATNLQKQIDEIKEKEQTEGVYFKKSTPYDEFFDQTGNKLKTPEGWQLGDVRHTMKSDIGEDWYLCNGDYIPNTDGELEPFIQLNETAIRSINIDRGADSAIITNLDSSDVSSTDYPQTLQVANGMYFIFLGGSLPTLYFSEDLEHWQKATFGSIQLLSGRKVVYIKGKYYIFSKTYSPLASGDDLTTFKVLESTDLLSWSEKVINVDQTGAGGSSRSSRNKYLGYIGELNGRVVFIFSADSSNYNYSPKVGIADNMDSTVYVMKDSINSSSVYSNIVPVRGQTSTTLANVIDNKLYLVLGNDGDKTYYVYRYRVEGNNFVQELRNAIPSTLRAGTDQIGDFIKVENAYFLAAVDSVWASEDLVSWTRVTSGGSMLSSMAALYTAENKYFYHVSAYNMAQLITQEDHAAIYAFLYSDGAAYGGRAVLNPDFPDKSYNRFRVMGVVERSGVMHVIYMGGTSTDDYGSDGIKKFILKSPFDSAKLPTISLEGTYSYVKAKE